jgi:hypothetical protein
MVVSFTLSNNPMKEIGNPVTQMRRLRPTEAK